MHEHSYVRLFILSLALHGFFGGFMMAADAPVSAPLSTPLRVACVGDSITQGAGAETGKSYPSQLQKLLGSGWIVGNFGVSGRTLLKNGDNPYWNETAYQPDRVIILLGTNDTKPQNWKHEAEFITDYTELVKSFQVLASKPKIFICRPCPVPEPGNFGISESGVLEEIKRLDALAAEMKLSVIDMHAALADKPHLLPDRVHPNTEGAAEMAKTAYKALMAGNAAKSE